MTTTVIGIVFFVAAVVIVLSAFLYLKTRKKYEDRLSYYRKEKIKAEIMLSKMRAELDSLRAENAIRTEKTIEEIRCAPPVKITKCERPTVRLRYSKTLTELNQLRFSERFRGYSDDMILKIVLTKPLQAELAREIDKLVYFEKDEAADRITACLDIVSGV